MELVVGPNIDGKKNTKKIFIEKRIDMFSHRPYSSDLADLHPRFTRFEPIPRTLYPNSLSFLVIPDEYTDSTLKTEHVHFLVLRFIIHNPLTIPHAVNFIELVGSILQRRLP
jgi:hypothetical protein